MNSAIGNEIRFLQLGEVDYQGALVMQQQLVEQRLASEIPDTVLMLTHPAVITLGRGAHEENLLLTREQFAERGVEIAEIDRGGDVTYHGPGQLVIYPILDLSNYKEDLHWYLRTLEEVIIQTIAEFGVVGRRFSPHTGVWVGDEKIAAIGIKVKRWVTSHGIGLNVNIDPVDFAGIVPCGIHGFGVTSLHLQTNRPIYIEKISRQFQTCFESVFRDNLHLA